MIIGWIISIKSLIWFFLIKKSKVIVTEVSSAELFAYLNIDPVSAVSDAIELAHNHNLTAIDNLAETNRLWTREDWPREYEELKYVLKLGWLIQNIKKYGVNNPIQLLQTANGKYVVHPGTARALVLSYVLPLEKIKVLYVWNPELDPDPFFIQKPYQTIDSIFSFLKLFKKSIRFTVKSACLNETTLCVDGHKYFYFKLATDSLKKTHLTFNIDFITFIDNSHWFSKIKNKIYFRDIISFEESKCKLGGVEFTKINNRWIANND